MVEISLECAIAGQAGTFDVTIDDSIKVSVLKKVVKHKNLNTITCDAKNLQLFLAKKADGVWMHDDDPGVLEFEEGRIHPNVQKLMDGDEMIADWTIRDVLNANQVPNPQSRQVHVLVKVPDPVQAQVDMVPESLLLLREAIIRQSRMDMRRMEMRLEQLASSLPHKPSSSLSDADMGQFEYTRLERTQSIVDAEPTENEEAFWSKDFQKSHVTPLTKETDLVAFITPYFNGVLQSCGMVFVNSESIQWLSQYQLASRKTDLKLDGFATHRGMYRRNEKVINCPAGFRFGVPNEELYDCAILFECKIKITKSALGQVARYFQFFCPTSSASAILFDCEQFWLINSHRSVLTKVKKAKWVDNGSKLLFRNFIAENMSRWVTGLSDACSALGVDVVEGEAFLGRGAYGRVFQVRDRDGAILALKIVESVARLQQEATALARAVTTGLTISPVGEHVAISDFAALLLTPVGKTLAQPTTRQEVQELYQMLFQLHMAGLAHGDPRVPNVVLNGETRLWIDLVDVLEATSPMKRVDCQILTRSILGDMGQYSSVNLDQLIDDYSIRTTQATLDRLAEGVSQVLELIIS